MPHSVAVARQIESAFRPGRRRASVIGAVCLAVLLAAHAARGQETEAPVHPSSGLTMAELQVWNDPAFRRRFAESYMAETDIEPRVTEDERQGMLAILDLISSDRMEEAARRLEKERSRNAAASAVFDFTVANIHFQQEKLQEAAAAYDVAVEKFPRFRRAWKNLALIHMRQGDYDRAVPALTRVIELGGNDSVTYGLLGFAYTSIENYLSAESAYRMAILLDAGTLDWKLGLARCFFRQERFAEAVSLCDVLIEEFPDRVDLWMLQANARIGLNQPLKAAETLELVDHLGGSTAESLNLLGDIYVNEELYELAAQSYLRAMQGAREGGAGRAVRAAAILAARGAYPETRLLIEGIEQMPPGTLDPESRKEMLKLRARLAVADGTADEEVKVLEEIVELDPLDGEALLLLGQHAARSGDPAKAEFYYQQAAGIGGFEADAKVRHAQLLVSQGEYVEATALLQRAQQLKYRENVREYLEQVERAAKLQARN